MRLGLKSLTLLLALGSGAVAAANAETASRSPRTETRLSGDGWKLWRDEKAEWKSDKLFLPPVDVSKLPVNPPTCGWLAMYAGKEAIAVSVPGTVEEYFWDAINGTNKTEESSVLGDFTGVSWWWRTLEVPTGEKGKRILLKFERNRLRSEVFINEKLVGYDLIGDSTFEIDITDAVKLGEKNTLAVRITDAGGNFLWPDAQVFAWGTYKIPISHGFGGIAGDVDMRMVDPVYIDNVFMKNRSEMTAVDVQVTVQNSKRVAVTGTLQIDIVPAQEPKTLAFSQRYTNVTLQPGESLIEQRVSLPSAKLWHYNDPNLYFCHVKIEADACVDQEAVRFGFRWLGIAERGKDDHFLLNGKPEFLLSAISWGFWPVNGITPSDELAEKQIRQAKGLNMNMLTFHRHKGHSIVLDKADEIGLLYYAEPGGYCCAKGDTFSYAMARLKWFRMIKEFRNHPSLVIYNMINENGHTPKAHQAKDMLDAHTLDPSRIITYTSGINPKNPPCKLHMLPYDANQYTNGWWDFHHACSLGVSADSLYKSPTNYSYSLDNAMRKEIIYLGEEGAVGAPPRLQLINDYFKIPGHRNGWDGADYGQWFNAFDFYLKQKSIKNLTVDQMTVGLANTQYYYHGRMIENAKINDFIDGYAINGWECEKLENHSGIVDVFRNYKGDPAIIQRYTRPVYVAIKARNKVVHVSDSIDADFFIINGGGLLDGAYTLYVDLVDPEEKVVSQERWSVSVSPQRLGTLVKEKAGFTLRGAPGYYTIRARLMDKNGTQQADGIEKLFTVDWKAAKLPTQGAIIESANTIHDFLSTGFKIQAPPYQDNMRHLDYLVLDNSVGVIPPTVFQTPNNLPGLKVDYYNGRSETKKLVSSRIEPNIRKSSSPVGVTAESTMIWTGHITPKESGSYILCGDFLRGRLNIWIDDVMVMDRAFGANRKARFANSKLFIMEAAKAYSIKIQYERDDGNDTLELQWQRQLSGSQCDGILNRVSHEGTTLIVSGDSTEVFAQEIAKRELVKYRGSMDVDVWWKAGGLFTVEHPLFKELPQNTGMNWEFQDVAKYEVKLNADGLYNKESESKRYGLLLDGEEVAAFCTDGHKFKIASTVSVVRHGKGKIVLSCLDLYPYLTSERPSANVVKKIFCNYLEYANTK
ncbi:MAG: sugar-binding domain-containing protein [bacterium]